MKLLIAIALLCCASAQAGEMLAMSTNLTDNNIPTSLPSARNITLELLPEVVPEKTDLWVRIRNGFAMQELDSKLVANHEKWYASRPEYIERMTERARRYLHFITEEVERRGMPSEIALLPMIESAFNPGAYSRSAASGIWQFIPSTGKHFGLQQNWWYDGRRDVIEATNSALDYLQKLHNQFGDWELALAAYNCGEGAVDRAQKRNRSRGLPTDYAHLQLPKETLNYVPKLLAIKHIVATPENFGLTLQPIENKPYFAAVAITQQMDVKKFSELAEISEEEFTALNPAHNRPIIMQDHTDQILLPIDHVNIFLDNLRNNDKPLLTWQSYQPKKGERFDVLAPRFGMSVAQLKSVNGLMRRGDVSHGQTLLVPVTGDSVVTDLEPFNMHLLPERAASTVHIVRRGDTLSGIAKKYHTRLNSLRAWNHNVKQLHVGQRVVVAANTSVHKSGKKIVKRTSSTSRLAAKNNNKKLANESKQNLEASL